MEMNFPTTSFSILTNPQDTKSQFLSKNLIINPNDCLLEGPKLWFNNKNLLVQFPIHLMKITGGRGSLGCRRPIFVNVAMIQMIV